MEDRNKPDWSSFTVNQPMDIPKNKIVESWLCQAELEKWFLKLAEFKTRNGEHRKRNEQIQPGDQYSWRWHGWPDSIEEHGEILNPRDDEFLRFIFGKAGTVSVKIIEEADQTILSLTQENIPEDEYSKMNFHVGCKTGWTFYMLNLKSILKDGPDLRNKNSELQMD
ncbi:SRPBCC domain-containing protein [Gramella lutea]|uniref:SRPBCC domain-containing protein n=1 Tax=Christiangramia lutea TaxID=1607951 RepID=A0A9X1V4Q7_9FLAO|nr:SRPBCC domain-containing protein [Christiangramia lutea]MCH4823626.1 SRPBCC domain-containing protein [Christiangramia lutea]